MSRETLLQICLNVGYTHKEANSLLWDAVSETDPYTFKPKEVRTLCSECSDEFEIKMHHNGCMSRSISNYDDCPKCGERNDTWLAIQWETEEGL